MFNSNTYQFCMKVVMQMPRAIRYSRQREKIYEYLLRSSEHPSAEMIYAALKEDLPELSLATVYRNLKLLEELQQVRRVTSHQGTERYDAICGDHAHFLCEECGAISDLSEVDLQQLRDTLPLGGNYEVTHLSVTLTGRCPSCS